MESIYEDSTLPNRYADVIYPEKEVLQVSTRDYRNESSMTSDSINRLILEYLGIEDRK